MKFALTSFALCLILMVLNDCYKLEIRDWQKIFLALVCSFFCGMCFGEYLTLLILLHRSRFFYQDLEKVFEHYG